MKTKKMIIALFMVTVIVSAFAQSNSKTDSPKFELGLLGGLNIPRLTGGGENPLSKDWSSLGRIGYAQGVGFGNIFVDFRGAYGLTYIQKNTKNGKSHPGNLLIAVGYTIPL